MTGLKKEDCAIKNIANFVFFQNLLEVTGKEFVHLEAN